MDRAVPSRRRWGWIPLAGGLFAIAGIGLFALALRDDEAPACEAGVSWQQRPTNRQEGTLLSTESEAGIMHGGALIGFPNPDEAAAMGLTTGFVVISNDEFHAIDRVPREGFLFRERSTAERPGRFFYSAGGAVYEVDDPANLGDVDLSERNAIPIPAFGLDGARRVPPAGTLLRVSGEQRTWVVDGGGRRTAEHLCDGARVVMLPSDPAVLHEIQVLPERPA
jgi:hypothetical protein